MSKVHPHQLAPSSPPPLSLSTSLSLTSSTREIFTIWMKSLILGGKGCTAFDSKGQIVYRVDNYSSKCCHKVFIMDSQGKVLLTILRKKFTLLGHWEGYRAERKKGGSCWFQVRKCWRIPKKPLECEVIVNMDHDEMSTTFKIERGKTELSSCRIVDGFGGLIAEMKRKQSVGGVVLGDDVLSLVVEPNVDHSLVMGLMVAYNLVDRRM